MPASLSAMAASGFSMKREMGWGWPAPCEARSEFEIAIARLRPARRNAEGDDLARPRGGKSRFDGAAKARRIRYHVIGGRDQHERFGVLLVEPQRRAENGGGGVARLGFDQRGAGRNADRLPAAPSR